MLLLLIEIFSLKKIYHFYKEHHGHTSSLVCVIVDINVAKRVLIHNNDKDYLKLHKAIYSKTNSPVVKIVYGGKLTDEYVKDAEVMQTALLLMSAGKAQKVDYHVVSKEAMLIKNSLRYKSNDEHILALARVSGARILASSDKDLKTDFKDQLLINKPRGKIYGSPTHGSLLNRLCK